MLNRILLKAYRRALASPGRYYTNQCEFECNHDDPEVVIYFIHGLGGAPGQAALLLPTLQSLLGNTFYLRSMHIPELDVGLEFYDRYGADTADLIRARIVEDLDKLTETYPGRRIFVAASSHALYDFIYAYPCLSGSIVEKLVLVWLACASDDYAHLEARYHRFLKLFYAINGFDRGDYKWYFGINHNLLRFINTETRTSFSYRDDSGRKITYLKRDIEMRFKCLGLQWTDPICVHYVRDYLDRQIENASPISDIRCHVLAGKNDGYWHDTSEGNFRATISRYVADYELTLVPTSHLWCVMPPYAAPFLDEVFRSELPAGARSH